MTFLEILGAVATTATDRVAAGSQRNARAALDGRYRLTREGRDVLLALGTTPTEAVDGRHSA